MEGSAACAARRACQHRGSGSWSDSSTKSGTISGSYYWSEGWYCRAARANQAAGRLPGRLFLEHGRGALTAKRFDRLWTHRNVVQVPLQRIRTLSCLAELVSQLDLFCMSWPAGPNSRTHTIGARKEGRSACER